MSMGFFSELETISLRRLIRMWISLWEQGRDRKLEISITFSQELEFSSPASIGREEPAQTEDLSVFPFLVRFLWDSDSQPR